MRLRVVMILVLSLGLIACGKTDDSAKQVSTVSEVSDKDDSTVVEEPAETVVVEATEEAVEIVAEVTEPVESPQEKVASVNAGESVYSKACKGCHLSGAAGAPKLGDAAAWADRIAKGADALVQSAINGVPGTAMMARGTCNACSDDDLKAAVEYMISQSQ